MKVFAIEKYGSAPLKTMTLPSKPMLVVLICSIGAALIACDPKQDLVGTWEFVPSQEQNEFAASMNMEAGPLKYTFKRDDTYVAVGGPLSGNNYVEKGIYEFDGQTLVLHRKSVGGSRSPVYERTNRNGVRFENEGSILVGDSDFGNWSFMGTEVRFSKR